MGASSDPTYNGVYIVGNGTTVKNCVIAQSGWQGIEFMGSNVLIEQNFIDSFCMVKDDGGGIYTYNGGNSPVSNRIIRNNIILNAIGAFAGAESVLL